MASGQRDLVLNRGDVATGNLDYLDNKAERAEVRSSSSSSSSSSRDTTEKQFDSDSEKADRSGKGKEEKAADSEEEKADRSGKGEEEKAAKGTKRLDLEAENEELRRTLARFGERVEELEKAKSEHDQGQELLQALALSNLETARRLIEERADVNAREPTLRANI